MSNRKSKNKNVRTAKEKAKDLKEITVLRKRGYGWRTIAKMINAKRDYELVFTVYYKQYHTVVSGVQKEALENKDELILAELSEIDWQIDELMEAWEKSKGTKQKTTTKADAEGDEESIQIMEWEESGEPRYMAEITKLRERRAKLLGLDAASRVDHTTGGESFKVTMNL